MSNFGGCVVLKVATWNINSFRLRENLIVRAISEYFANLGHARHVAAVLESGITVHNFYVPAGGDEPDPKINEKFSQKLDYLTQMEQYFENFNIKNKKKLDDHNNATRPDYV